MNSAEQERIEHLDAFQRDMEERDRRFIDESNGPELSEGMRALARALGVPEDKKGFENHFRRRRFRRRMKILAACAVPFVLVALIVVALVFG